MRAAPQLDPRIQQGAMYAPGPSQVYLKPPTHPNVPLAHNYAPNGQPQNYGVPLYQVHHPQPQVVSAPLSQAVAQGMQNPAVRGEADPIKMNPGLTSIYGQSEGYPSRAPTQDQAPPVQ
jgi:hypothetical protein